MDKEEIVKLICLARIKLKKLSQKICFIQLEWVKIET